MGQIWELSMPCIFAPLLSKSVLSGVKGDPNGVELFLESRTAAFSNNGGTTGEVLSFDPPSVAVSWKHENITIQAESQTKKQIGTKIEVPITIRVKYRQTKLG